MRFYIALLLLVVCTHKAGAQAKLTILDSSTFTSRKGVILSKTSFRGLSVVSKKVIWVSGNRGTYGRSTDGGKTFVFTQLEDYNKTDFRDIEAFDANTAIMISSGSPAYILRTTDGGHTWKEVFKDGRPEIFLDAMDFWDNKHGLIVGDPIDKHFVLLETKDKGETWKFIDTTYVPFAYEGEAIFAASGTTLRCLGKDEFAFVSGGQQSRFMHATFTPSGGISWRQQLLQIRQGKSSQGAFSLAVDGRLAIAVGGDYTTDADINSVACATLDFDVDPFKPAPNIIRFTGYRSCVEIITKDYAIGCGSSGVDVTRILYPSETTPQPVNTISKESFNVVRKDRKGKAIFIAGNKGRIGKIEF